MMNPLKAYREARRITQAELADQLGERRSTVHRWESGERKIGQGKLANVSEKTGIPAAELRPDLAELFGGVQ